MGFDQCNSIRFSLSCPDVRFNDHLDPWVKPAFPSPLPRAATHLKDNPPKTDVAVEAIQGSGACPAPFIFRSKGFHRVAVSHIASSNYRGRQQFHGRQPGCWEPGWYFHV